MNHVKAGEADAECHCGGCHVLVHEDAEDAISFILLAQLGQSGRSHRREFAKGYRHLVYEIYSPPRVTKEIKKGRYRNLAPGFALDLVVVDPEDGQPWDFSQRDKREKLARCNVIRSPFS